MPTPLLLTGVTPLWEQSQPLIHQDATATPEPEFAFDQRLS
jgi:hypothetical protein